MKKKKQWSYSLGMVSIALINVGAVFRLPSSVCNMEMFEAVEHNVGPEWTNTHQHNYEGWKVCG